MWSWRPMFGFFCVIVLSSSTGFAEKHSHGGDFRRDTSAFHKHDGQNDSVFHNMVNDISIPTGQDIVEKGKNAGADAPNNADIKPGLGQVLPVIELIKLQTAAKNAGLTNAKADRVARAVQALNMNYHEVADLRKIYNNPATSAEYADQIRRSLEEAAIDQEVKGNDNDNAKRDGVTGKDRRDADDASNSQVSQSPSISPNQQRFESEAVKRVLEAAKLSGLTPQAAIQFLKSLESSNLNSADMKKLEGSIKEHGPSVDDLTKLMNHLKLTRRNTDEAEGRQGSDWIFDQDSSSTRTVRGNLPDHKDDAAGKKKAKDKNNNDKDDDDDDDDEDDDKDQKLSRSLFDNTVTKTKLVDSLNQVDATLFRARRYCGFSPNVDSTRLSNASPGQYPWSAAIMSQDNVFLCAGSLISEDTVLTTASCITKYKQISTKGLKVLLGAWSLPLGHQYLPEVEVFVRAAILHPSHNEGSTLHDVGLLQLYKSINFDLSPHIFPVCIIGPKFDSFAATGECRVLGWPEMPHMEEWRSSCYLASGDVKIFPEGCSGNTNMPCATGHACVGNAGSPVICLTNSQRYYQWGIVASEPNCDRTSSVSIPIISVINNHDFIEKNLWTRTL